MTCCHTVILSVIFFVSAQPAPSSPAPQYSGNSKDVVLRAARPKYPKDAQGYYPKGSGIVRMEIDKKSGLVKSARMEKSTGNKVLDDAALQACNQWRFKPGMVSTAIGLLRFGITVVEYVTAWLAQLSQTECPQSV